KNRERYIEYPQVYGHIKDRYPYTASVYGTARKIHGKYGKEQRKSKLHDYLLLWIEPQVVLFYSLFIIVYKTYQPKQYHGYEYGQGLDPESPGIYCDHKAAQE